MTRSNDSIILTPAPRSLPIVRLSDDGEHVVVLPQGDFDGPGDQPLHLPPVPKSLTDWVALLGERFRRVHRRCVATVLLLDVRTAGWSAAVPAQRCGRTAACWSAARVDFPHFPPDAVVAGSFQTRVLSPGEDPGDCPPPHDGLHFVHVLAGDGESQTIHSYFRAGGDTRPVPAADVIFDDLEAVIEQALPRLTLA